MSALREHVAPRGLVRDRAGAVNGGEQPGSHDGILPSHKYGGVDLCEPSAATSVFHNFSHKTFTLREL